MGFRDGLQYLKTGEMSIPLFPNEMFPTPTSRRPMVESKPKRKLSAWQKYIKNKRNHIKYRDGKLNLKKMGVAFRKKKRR
jgi:hypothetical protein